jgi:copper oxidase (laccase) domain-containing protein
MGRKRGRRAAEPAPSEARGQRDSADADRAARKGAAGADAPRTDAPRTDAARRGALRAPAIAREIPVAGAVPRFEIPSWREQYGVVAGITARGSETGRGFDLGLWSDAPVGQVMSRWLALRREMAEFPAIALSNQVHGSEIMRLDRGRGWIHVEGIDGWVTCAPGILLTITIADCIPVYLLAPGRGVALLHGGWRGTAAGILRRGVQSLTEAAKCSPTDLIMHCGVGICGGCYEVGAEVMSGCGMPADGGGPWRLDLRDRLAVEGSALGLTRITISPWCSAHDRPTFYSHRGSQGTDGRMVAFLGMAGAVSVGIDSNLLPE